jgi:hypothetical protein
MASAVHLDTSLYEVSNEIDMLTVTFIGDCFIRLTKLNLLKIG